MPGARHIGSGYRVVHRVIHSYRMGGICRPFRVQGHHFLGSPLIEVSGGLDCIFGTLDNTLRSLLKELFSHSR